MKKSATEKGPGLLTGPFCAPTTELTAQARRHGLTLNTVIQTAWAILLDRLTGRE